MLDALASQTSQPRSQRFVPGNKQHLFCGVLRNASDLLWVETEHGVFFQTSGEPSSMQSP